VLEVVDNVPVD